MLLTTNHRQTLTPLQFRIMRVLWQTGPSNVRSVQTSMLGNSKSAYTTVQTTLNKLERRGKVRRHLDGRSFLYTAVVSEESAVFAAVQELVDRLFAGSAEELPQSLMKGRRLDLGRLKEVVAGLEQSAPKGE